MEWKILAEELMQDMPERLRFPVETRAVRYNWEEINRFPTLGALGERESRC